LAPVWIKHEHSINMSSQIRKDKINVLVTGGAGFLGKAIVRELLEPDCPIAADRVRLGNGKARCQHIYVGNIAYSHLQAADALMNGSEHKVGGQVYFMTDAPGSNFFKFFDQVVVGAGYRIRPVKN